VLKVCRNLLVVDTILDHGQETTTLCRFAHLSVQEFLESRDGDVQMTKLDAHCLIAKVCLSSLLHPISWDDRYSQHSEAQGSEEIESSKNKQSFGDNCGRLFCLIPYTSECLPAHCRVCDTPNANLALSTSLKAFLGSMSQSSTAYQTWAGSAKQFRYARGLRSTQNLKPFSTPMPAICCFGLFHLLSDWWRTCTSDINARNTYGDPLLITSLQQGESEVSKRLVELRAELNTTCDIGSPLRVAIRADNVHMIEMLIQAGADLELQVDEHETALHLACRRDNQGIVQTLLRGGADINAKDNRGETVLHLAYLEVEDNSDMMRLLLLRGANVNALGRNNDTILHLACQEGRADIVAILLEAKPTLK
jgi:hypothetical protein